MSLQDKELLIFDGAVGTNLQKRQLSPSVWDGKEGCYEYLNLTAPEVVVDLHRSFLDVGAMVLKTNTFGGSRIVLDAYGLGDRVYEINQKAVFHAKKAINGRTDKYVAGSIGPTNKLPSLGHITVDNLFNAMKEQSFALIEAGVDAIIIETCQDLLQVKTTLVACQENLLEQNSAIPVLASVTFEPQGTMLLGSDIGAVLAMVEPFSPFSLGLNCATGPAEMASHIRYLSQNWPGRISCIPNQGIPEVVDGETIYPLKPEAFARLMVPFVTEEGVSIVGGCCGSTPAHIRCLVDAMKDVLPKSREV